MHGAEIPVRTRMNRYVSNCSGVGFVDAAKKTVGNLRSEIKKTIRWVNIHVGH